MRKNESTFMALDKAYDDASIVVFGVPYDGTTSYRPGTRFASSEMRNNFDGLETYSPYLDLDLEDANICDAGDLDIPFGNVSRALAMIEEETMMIVNDGKTPFMVGGEHLVTLGAVKAVSKKHPNLKVIHFDAHADLRNDYMGEPLSHATVIRRCHALLEENSVFQFGIRSGTKDEFTFSEGHTYMERYSVATIKDVVATLNDEPVYITIDLDVLDPSVFPGTGTPEPGGVSFSDLMNAVHSLQGLNIVGADVVELSPQYDTTGASTAVACKIMRELLLVMEK